MWQVLRMVVSTYQAASGAGAAAMEELKLQTKEVCFFFPMLLFPVVMFVWLHTKWSTLHLGLGREGTDMQHFQTTGCSCLQIVLSWTSHVKLSMNSLCWTSLSLVQYAFNIFSHNAPVLENGYNEEEMKMVKETRKIWVSVCHIDTNNFYQICINFCQTILFSGQFELLSNFKLLHSQNNKEVKVTATCIRVPVMRAHAESVNLQFEKPLDEVSICMLCASCIKTFLFVAIYSLVLYYSQCLFFSLWLFLGTRYLSSRLVRQFIWIW